MHITVNLAFNTLHRHHQSSSSSSRRSCMKFREASIQTKASTFIYISLTRFLSQSSGFSGKMGCIESVPLQSHKYIDDHAVTPHNAVLPENSKVEKPKPWKHSEPITEAQLMKLREEFWDTSPYNGGQREIWDSLRAAAESDTPMLAQAILDSAGVIIQKPDLTLCYDEKGAKYELPKYVLSKPSNLIRDK